MPGVSGGMLVNLWSVAPREFSCDHHEEWGGEVHQAFWCYHSLQNKLINPLCYMHLVWLNWKGITSIT